MGERKVLNKYFPPDFDPSKIPRHIGKRNYDAKMEVRMMLPFNMCCLVCGHYMYRGKKFNSMKENAKGEDYLGIRIVRFYIKCEMCNNQITFKTDPKNGDYAMESGASRNFEVWRQTDDTDEKANVAEEEEEPAEEDAMTTLESRTLDSKREMDILDALDEIKSLNQAREKVDISTALDRLHDKQAAAAKKLEGGTHAELEDEALVQRLFGSDSQQQTIRRLDEGNAGSSSSQGASATPGTVAGTTATRAAEGATVQFKTRKRKAGDVEKRRKKKKAPVPQKPPVAAKGLVAYSSSDSD